MSEENKKDVVAENPGEIQRLNDLYMHLVALLNTAKESRPKQMAVFFLENAAMWAASALSIKEPEKKDEAPSEESKKDKKEEENKE